MFLLASVLFFVLAAAGIVLVAAQAFYVRRLLRRPPLVAIHTPPISILKPLCGLESGLEENLQSFVALPYAEYEVLLGFKSETDSAMPLARSFVSRCPTRFRIVLQQGEPGLNPKVNQLITLSKAARHDVLVVSDASVCASPDYLTDIAACLEDPQVALVTHMVAGVGEKTLGSLFDNIYLTTHFSAGAAAAKAIANQDLVIGKSMAFRREDLRTLGGFEAAKDYLAEDFFLGRRVGAMGRKVVLGRTIVLSVSQTRSLRDFVNRFCRWAVLQRRAVGLVMFCLQTFMYPTMLAAVGFLLLPSMKALAVLAAIAALKSALDVVQARMLRPTGCPARAAWLMPFNDLLIAWAWFYGLRYDRVEWRGNLLEVTQGTYLVPIESSPEAPGQGSVAGETHATR